MALKSELLKRRQRIQLPRAPERPLRAEVPRGADEELKELLEQLVSLADRETLFTSTLELSRLVSALGFGGYVLSVLINVENQIAPGGIATTYVPVAPGFTYIPAHFEYWSSLPWWLTTSLWFDTDVPAPPTAFWVRAPEHLAIDWESLSDIHRFLRYTIINNHGVNTVNFCASHWINVVTDDTWRMMQVVYLKPIVDYIRDKAEKETGRPYP